MNPVIAGYSVFSQKVTFDASQLAHLLLFLSRWGGEPLWLSMDRTNWQFGETDHNLLVISAQIGDTAVPLIWKALGKAGNSNGQERIALMQRLLRFLPKDKIAGLLADREFIGEKWLGWLMEEKIPFVARLKGNMIARCADGSTLKLSQMYQQLREGSHSTVQPVTLGKALKLSIQAKRTTKGLVIVACYGLEEKLAEPVNLYRKRWKIECAFACLKRKGFGLEDTHITEAKRLETLMGVVAIAYAWAFIIGMLAPAPAIKNHRYPANCRFTIGKHTLIHATNFTEKITKLTAYAFCLMAVKGSVV